MIRQFILIHCMVLVLSMQAVTTATEITVLDQNAKPVPNAVLEVMSSSPSTLDTTKTYIVDQVDKSFVPYVRIVPEGAYVDFPNSDNIRHHVYSFSKAKPFELKLYSDRPEKPIQFSDSGIVVLGCNIHDSMVGFIYVTTSKHTYKSDAKGMIRLNDLPDDALSANLWHPNASQGVEYRLNIEADALKAESLTLTIAITDPAPRNTFEDVFKKQ